MFFFLMIRRPPRSTQSRSSAASDVYKRQGQDCRLSPLSRQPFLMTESKPVSYTHLRAHETRHDIVCRLLLEKKKTISNIEPDIPVQSHQKRIPYRISPVL